MIKFNKILEGIIDVESKMKEIMHRFTNAKKILFRNDINYLKKTYLLNNLFRDLNIHFDIFDHDSDTYYDQLPMEDTGICYQAYVPVDKRKIAIFELDSLLIDDLEFMKKNYHNFLKNIEPFIRHELTHVEQLKKDKRSIEKISGSHSLIPNSTKLDKNKYYSDKRETMAYANEFVGRLKKHFSKNKILNILKNPSKYREEISLYGGNRYNNITKTDFWKYAYLYAINY